MSRSKLTDRMDGGRESWGVLVLVWDRRGMGGAG